MLYGKGNKVNNKTAQNRVFMTFLVHLLMENSINGLHSTLVAQTLSSVSVGKQPHTTTAAPGAVGTEMTELVGMCPQWKMHPFTTSWRKVFTEQGDMSPGSAHPGMLCLESPRQSWGQSYGVGHGLRRWRTLPQEIVWVLSCGFAGVVGCSPESCCW